MGVTVTSFGYIQQDLRPDRIRGFEFSGGTRRLEKVMSKSGSSLFAIHLCYDPSQLGGLRGGQLIDSVSQTLLADGSYLIDSYFSRFFRTGYL
jgi:hypothetical protein